MATADGNPGYLECFLDIKTGFQEYLKSATYSNGEKFISNFNAKLLYEDFVSDLHKFVRVSMRDACLAMALGFIMTFLRFLSTTFVFKVSRYLAELLGANSW